MHQAEAELRRGPESRHGVVHRAHDAIVVAKSLGTLAPLDISDLNSVPLSASVVPSA